MQDEPKINPPKLWPTFKPFQPFQPNVTKCSKCGMEFPQITSYTCSRYDCGIFAKVTC